MLHHVTRFALLLGLAIGLGGCDKCGDYFWLGSTATPHSCKEAPAPH